MAPSKDQAVVKLLGGLAQAMASSKHKCVVNLLGGLAQAMAPSKHKAVVILLGELATRCGVPIWHMAFGHRGASSSRADAMTDATNQRDAHGRTVIFRAIVVEHLASPSSSKWTWGLQSVDVHPGR